MYRLDTHIGYSQLGVGGALSFPALLDLFQDIATLHAHTHGFGLEALYALDRAWILSRWRVRLGQMPRCCDPVTLATRAYECRRALNRRCFSLETPDGAVLAQADSLWTLIDTKTGGPVDAAAIVAPYLTPGPAPDLGDLPRKVQLPGEAAPLPPFLITDDLLDTNRHVNNVRSAALAAGCLPGDFTFTGFAADYHHPLLPGHRVEPLLAPTDRGFAVALTAGGRVCVSAEFIR